MEIMIVDKGKVVQYKEMLGLKVLLWIKIMFMGKVIHWMMLLQKSIFYPASSRSRISRIYQQESLLDKNSKSNQAQPQKAQSHLPEVKQERTTSFEPRTIQKDVTAKKENPTKLKAATKVANFLRKQSNRLDHLLKHKNHNLKKLCKFLAAIGHLWTT